MIKHFLAKANLLKVLIANIIKTLFTNKNLKSFDGKVLETRLTRGYGRKQRGV